MLACPQKYAFQPVIFGPSLTHDASFFSGEPPSSRWNLVKRVIFFPYPLFSRISPINSTAGTASNKCIHLISFNLVGGFNPFEKYAGQIGSFPQVGLNTKNVWNTHLTLVDFRCHSPLSLSTSQSKSSDASHWMQSVQNFLPMRMIYQVSSCHPSLMRWIGSGKCRVPVPSDTVCLKGGIKPKKQTLYIQIPPEKVF